MRRDEVKRLVEAHGPEAFTEKLIEMLGEKKVKPEDVSIQGLWEGLVGPIHETLGQAHQAGNKIHFLSGLKRKSREEVTSSLFPIAVGALIATKVIEGYNTVGYIGDQLVTIFPSKIKIDTIHGFTASEGMLVVEEGKEYEDSGVGEKYVTMSATKRGRFISITEETVIFDQTGKVLLAAQGLGEKARLDRELRILKGVSGNDTNVYKPSNAAATFYSAGNLNLITSNALFDWTNIDTVLQSSADQVDSNGDKIVVNPTQLLVPRALLGTALRVTQATGMETHDPAASTQYRAMSPVPFAGMFRPLSSPLLDGLSGTGATDWYLGDFKKSFWYKEIYPIQTLAAKEGHPDEFDRDIKFKFKVREYGDIAAVDHVYCYRSQA